MTAVPFLAVPGNAGRAVLDEATCGYLLTDADGVILQANRLFAEWAGRSLEALESGQVRLQDLLTPASRIFHGTHYTPLLAMQGFAYEISFDLQVPDKAPFPVLLNARVGTASDDRPPLTSITVFSAGATRKHERALMTARAQAESAAEALEEANVLLRDQKERLRITLHSMTDAVVSTDAAGRIASLNPVASEMLGVSEREALGHAFDEVVQLRWLHSDEPRPNAARQCLERQAVIRQVPDTVLVSRNGTRWRVEDTTAPILGADGRIAGVVWVCRDVTERHLLSESLEHAVHHDKLTGLLNRDGFERALAKLLHAPSFSALEHLLCHLDVDGFKLVNDSAGHLAGNALLCDLAELLRSAVRNADTLARLGDDEFCLLLAGCSMERGREIAEAIRERIEAHRFEWDGALYGVTVSIGIAPLPRDTASVPTVLNDAGMACRAAKQGGKNRVHAFSPSDALLENLRSEVHSIGSLRRALQDDRLVLYFQPIVSTAEPRAPVKRGEVLLRLRDEAGSLQSPGAFIPAAERHHQMSSIDRWVVDRTFRWLANHRSVQCSVNVSGQSLGDASFRHFVLERLQATKVDPAQLCFEITETAAVANLALAREFIATMRAQGCRFALDDFGAGLSSFGYLRALKVDYVKIDGSFVKGMDQDAQSHAIVESIHRVARVSGLGTVAEFVENETILEALREIGVDYAQGYGVGKPRPIDEWAS